MDTLSKSFDDLRRVIGWMIGQSREPDQWTPELTRNVRDVLVTGLSNFYWYVPDQGQEQYSWSFLKPSKSLSVLADTDTYDLPPDFGGLYSNGFTFDSGTQPPVKLVTEEELRIIRGTEAKTATHPSYCAIRPKIASEGHEQLYEVIFYPKPTVVHTLRYRYSIIPGLIDDTDIYPHGSRLHSVTILESCLAVAQRKFLDAEQSVVDHEAEFRKCLTASIHRDREFSDGAPGASLWPIETSVESLDLDRNALLQRIGRHMFELPNPGAWSHDEKRQVDLALATGLNDFYWYTPPEGAEAHTWSFLRPSASLSIVADTSTYDLPTDFGGLRLGGFTFESGTQAPIKLVTEAELRTLRGTLAQSANEPSYCSIRLKEPSEGFQQIYEVSFYPSPAAGHTLKYEYDVIPGFIDEQDRFPRGSRLHSVTILESCLAASEKILGEPGSHEAEFQKHLIASIQRDKGLPTGGDSHIWPIKSADTGLSLNRSDLRQRLGSQLFNKPNPGSWSHDEIRIVEQALVAGLTAFYWYTPPSGSESHSWSFLKPNSTLPLVADTDTYDLPADFGGIYSSGFTFESGNKTPIKLVTEEELRTLQSTLSQSATEPQYCAIRPKVTTGGFEQFYEAIFYPSPTVARTLRYRYSVIPGLIDDTNIFPYGSRLHSTTILESCLAAAEQITGQPNGPHEAEFQKSLMASVYRDREITDESTNFHIWPMEEMPTGLTFDRSRLRQRIGLLGFKKPNPGSWTHDEQSVVEQILVDGLSNFYWYTSKGEGPPHSWSFLKPSAKLSLLADTDTYDLPLDFGDLDSGQFTFDSGAETPIKLVTEEELRTIRGTLAQTATEPVYCAVRPKVISEGFEQVHEVIFYPKPTAAHTLRYRYSVIPGFVDEKNVYPLGSRLYSMAIMESCLASAQRELGIQGPVDHEAEFQKCLAASISRDQKFLSASATTSMWPVEDSPSDLALDRDGLLKRLGHQVFNKPNSGAWSHDEKSRLEQILFTGLSNFYWYTPQQGAEGHTWSFLKPSATLNMAANTDTYDLPPDFGGLHSSVFTFDSGTQTPIKMVSEEELRTLRGTLAQTATEPSYCAIRPKAASEGFQQIYEVFFYPNPTADHTLRYRYDIIPGFIDDKNPFPYGSRLHSITILESCLLAADQFMGQSGPHEAEFQRCLAASIHRDQKFPDILPGTSIWPIESAPEDLSLNRSGLFRRIGHAMYEKPNKGSWTHDEKSKIEQVVMDGLRRFYYPMVLPNEREMHRWSFLYPKSVFNCVSGQYAYDLPEDFGALMGPMHYAPGTATLYPHVEEVAESQLEQLRQGGDHAGRSRYFAIRPKMNGEIRGTRYEIVLYPVPDQSYTLHYRYETNPKFIVEESEFPLGGQSHAQTLLEACLVSADRFSGAGKSIHDADYVMCLQSSVSFDRQLASQDTLGRDYDGSDVPYDTDYHDADLNVVTYTGYSPDA